MGVQCNILFDENNLLGTFFSGSIITGKVEIVLERPKRVRGIAIKFSGYATAQWTESRNRSSGTNHKNETIRYHGYEDYLASTTYLIGSNNGEEITMQPGIHIYSFACALPYQLPSSFESKLGHIRYTAKVILDRPWKFNQTHTVGFTVLKLVDLNYESPVLRMPPQVEINKEFYCGPCASKPLNIRVKLPQTGYVAGQTIEISTDINNESNIDISGVHLSLRKIVKYLSQHPIEKERIEVVTITKNISEPILKCTTKYIEQNIQIPAVPPTCTNLCKIIKISYEIQAKIKINGFHQSPRIQIPIFIGNIPLVNVISQQPMASNNQQSGNTLPVLGNILGLNRNNDNNQLLSDFLDLPPPSYEEAVFSTPININEDDLHPICRTEFIPRYAVYSFNNRTSMNLNLNKVYNSLPSTRNDGIKNLNDRWSTIPSTSTNCEVRQTSSQNNQQLNKRWTEMPVQNSSKSPFEIDNSTWL